jgi:hypothetical protein
MEDKNHKINESSLPNYWNPYHSFQKLEVNNIFTHIQTILNPFINSNIIHVLGPMNINIQQHIYKFTIRMNQNEKLFFQMIEENENEFAPITIKNDTEDTEEEDTEDQIKYCELSNINKNDKNSEKDLIEWAKIIANVLGFTTIYLQDNSYVIFPKLKYYSFPICALAIIKKNLGYYARFNFYPYKQTNSGLVNKSESIEKKINNLFQSVSWLDFDLFLDTNRNLQSMQEIQEKYNYFKNKFKQFSSPYYAFKYFNTEDCQSFIDLLDLFDKKYYNIPIKIPGIKLLNEINNVLLDCRWMNSI